MKWNDDEAVGIEPTLAETHERVVRVRGYLAECMNIVDELFPLEEAAPPRSTHHRQYGREEAHP